jgi:hypothetical protein
MLFHAMMEFCQDLLRSKFWLIGEWSIKDRACLFFQNPCDYHNSPFLIFLDCSKPLSLRNTTLWHFLGSEFTTKNHTGHTSEWAWRYLQCFVLDMVFLILGFHYGIMQSTSNVLMLMLYWSEKIIRNSMYLPPNTRPIHKTNNRLTLTTVFCFRVDHPVTSVTSYETQEYKIMI